MKNLVNNLAEKESATIGLENKSTKKSVEESLKKEAKRLKSLQGKEADDTVIAAQQSVINKLEQELSDVNETEKAMKISLVSQSLKFLVVNRETGNKTENEKKIAFVKNNRPINSKKVDEFISLIAKGEYEEAYPIIVMEAKGLIEKQYQLVGIDGEDIKEEDASNYYVILDGQHRAMAFAKLNATNEEYAIPNVYVKDTENVGKYLVKINNVGTSWDRKDKLTVASLVASEHKGLFKKISKLMEEGFNPTTACLIYTGIKISTVPINKILKDEKSTLPKKAKVDIERGDKFITLCKAAGMPVPIITKRYFIDGFNSHATSIGDENAFEALKKLKDLNLEEKDFKAIKTDNEFIAMLTRSNE
jgi:hypothetical protein